METEAHGSATTRRGEKFTIGEVYAAMGRRVEMDGQWEFYFEDPAEIEARLLRVLGDPERVGVWLSGFCNAIEVAEARRDGR